jgi:hypothetical protein
MARSNRLEISGRKLSLHTPLMVICLITLFFFFFFFFELSSILRITDDFRLKVYSHCCWNHWLRRRRAAVQLMHLICYDKLLYHVLKVTRFPAYNEQSFPSELKKLLLQHDQDCLLFETPQSMPLVLPGAFSLKSLQ